MELVDRTIKGISWNYINKIGELGLLFLLSVIAARLLGPESYGLYSIVAAFIGIYALLLSFGFNFNLNKYVPQLVAQGERGKLNHLVRHILSIRFLASTLICLLLYIFSEKLSILIGRPETAYYLKVVAIVVFFQSIGELLQYLFIGLINIKPLTIINISTRILQVGFAYLILRMGYGIAGLLYVMLGTSVLATLLYLLTARKFLLSENKKFDLKPIYRYGLIMWASVILTFILGKQVDILLLNHFLVTTAQIGFYNIAYDLSINLGVVLTVGFSGVIISTFSEIAAKAGAKGMGNAWSMILKSALLLVVPATALAAYYASPLITTIYSDAYTPVVAAFQLYILLMLAGRMIGGGSSYTVLMVVGRERFLLLTVGLAGVINIALDIILIPIYGVFGAIIATGTSLIIKPILELMFLRRFVPIKFPLAFLGKIVLISSIALAPTLLLEVNSLLTLFIAAVIYVTVFLFGILIARPFEPQEEEYLERIPPFKILRKIWR